MLNQSGYMATDQNHVYFCIAKSANLNYQIIELSMIYVSDNAKKRVKSIMEEKNFSLNDYFVRVSVQSGGCSGLSYKMDFDNEKKPMDQEFEDNGIKVVTDLKSFLYLVNTTLEFSDGLNGKGFYFNNPNAARSCACGESFSL
jgi:iron-sulfur cluster assembly protein